MSIRSLIFLCVAAVAFPQAARSESGVSFDASVYFYAVPNDANYLQPTVRADADRLHLEVRYNYEGKHTFSLWGGYAFQRGDRITVTFVPMLGVVGGNYSGLAPGGELTLGWKVIEFYTEGEYVHDFDDSINSFFYSWSELTASLPMHWRVGGAMQRTQTHQTPREFQGGVLVGTTLGRVEATVHVFDLDLDDRTWVLSAALAF